MKKLSVLSLLFLLAGCGITVLDPKSSTGKEQAFLIWFSFALMVLVVIVVFLLFIRFVSKYRYTKEKAGYTPEDVKGNVKLELTWTILPIVLLAVLAVPAIAITYNHSPTSDPGVEKEGVHIHVTAEQFLWTFTHENGKEMENELIMPEGEPIILHLKSKDVVHSFWVPALGGKVDVLPNKELIYEIKNPEKGAYQGKCAEYCGVQHTDMLFEAKVVALDDYKQFLQE